MKKLRHASRKYVVQQRKKARELWAIKNHPFIVPVTTFLVLFFITLLGFVAFNGQTIGAADSHVVVVSVDGGQRTLPSRAATVGDLLKRQNITVNNGDIVEPAVTSPILEDDFHINIYRARPVTIVDGDRKITVLTAHEQPRKIVETAGIQLYPEDGIKTAQPIDLSKEAVLGDKVVVDRAIPASINLYGTAIEVRTRAKTVGDLLKEKSIKTIEGDTVQPALSSAVTPNTQVFVVRVGKQIVTNEEPIAPTVIVQNDPNLAQGAEVVIEAGATGKKLVTYEIEVRNGKEVSRRVLQEVVASNPVKRVVSRGTKVVLTGTKSDWLIAAGIDPSEYGAVDYIISRESGWCPTKWQGEPGACPAFHGTPTSGLGYGLCQATPGSKMASAGADWAVNPVTQLKWCSNYARSKFGSWQGAYNFWVVNHWW